PADEHVVAGIDKRAGGDVPQRMGKAAARFKGTNVAPARRRRGTGISSLVGLQDRSDIVGATVRITAIDLPATTYKADRLCRTTVILQRSEFRIGLRKGAVNCAVARFRDHVVTVGSKCS